MMDEGDGKGTDVAHASGARARAGVLQPEVLRPVAGEVDHPRTGHDHVERTLQLIEVEKAERATNR